MANMSYCRFRNTVEDLQDCLDNLYETLSDTDEIRARKRLVKLAFEIASEFLDDDGELDPQMVDELPKI